jgi:hypothetical protein
MSAFGNMRAMAVLAATGALLLAAFAAAPQAEASTLYACVQKNGAAHIYTKKPKCKKHESKLSWITTGGPAGKNGTNGSNGTSGTNGTNGAVSGFSATVEEVNFTSGTEAAPTTIVSRTLPAGNYIVGASLDLDASDSVSGGEAAVECELVDTPIGGGSAVSDGALWAAVIDFEFIGGYSAITTMSLNLAVDSPARSSTIAIECDDAIPLPNGGTLETRGNKSSIVAVQTSTNS